MVGFTKEAREAAVIASAKAAKIRKAEKVNAYLLNPVLCSKVDCGKALSYEQHKGGIRFCCKACSNASVIRRKGIKNSPEIRQKLIKPGICRFCGKEHNNRKENGTRKYHCSDECIQNARLEAAKRSGETMKRNGTAPGWKSRSKMNISYPEQYFINLFKNENLEFYEREKNVGRWFIDFAFNDLKLAVEIDGSQHYNDPERMQSDRNKDEFLKNEGWEVFRVRWHNPSNDKGKSMLYPQIEALLKKISVAGV